MIYITINHNDDEIKIHNDEFRNSGTVNFKLKYSSTNEFESFLVELFNLMDISEIQLNSINEDKSKCIAEW